MEKDRIKKFYKKLFSINEIENYYKMSKYVLIFIWIFLSVFTCIEIRNPWEVVIFYFKGIIILLFTYFYFSRKIYFFETPIFEKLKYYPVSQENTFNMIVDDFIKYIIKLFLFCVSVHCISCVIYGIFYSTIRIKTFLYPSIIVFSFALLPGGIYLILERCRHIKLSKYKWNRNGGIKIIILLIISCMVSSYFLKIFFKAEIIYGVFPVATTSSLGYLDKNSHARTWGYVNEFMPDIDKLPKYKDIEYQSTRVQVWVFYAESLILNVQYDEKTYLEEKRKLEDKYTFLNKKILYDRYQDLYSIPNPKFSIGSYDFRVVKSFNDIDLYFPQNFGMIGISDEKKSIAYLYFVDHDLHYIDESMEDFVRKYFKYDF